MALAPFVESAPRGSLGDTQKPADATTNHHARLLAPSPVHSKILSRAGSCTSHPAGRKSLNIGLRKILVQCVPQDFPKAPFTGVGWEGGKVRA